MTNQRPHALEVVPIGDELGLIIPPELLSHLGVTESDALFLIETTQGFRLTARNPDAEPAR
jgi:antitoxin component of MazEF toxin-antitoxin module